MITEPTPRQFTTEELKRLEEFDKDADRHFLPKPEEQDDKSTKESK